MAGGKIKQDRPQPLRAVNGLICQMFFRKIGKNNQLALALYINNNTKNRIVTPLFLSNFYVPEKGPQIGDFIHFCLPPKHPTAGLEKSSLIWCLILWEHPSTAIMIPFIILPPVFMVNPLFILSVN